MNDLIKKLFDYGVDFKTVMERFVDDENLYIDCFFTFMKDPYFDGLSDAIDSGNYQIAFDHAHTLKGVAGNLGLTPLYDMICEIVEPLRNHDYTKLSQLHCAVLDEKRRLQHIL